ncbi:hypothetical protein A5893_07270 [Pedobacter psychrophilus]|uniref:Plasmid stabilization protein n=1 Tax=Pedobacter psychrophilus TaxID=1826909 RepID=A0A179DIX0_9SPHI|nr:type II toxin-antitoxin system RelE/ParE family toxin [Pedobacter psychrophilus]OAQ40732.1 hypothetical protein A5893_07270 [Pedobacter psychrophilus]
MEFEIIWTKKALTTFNDRIEYLQIHFNEKEIFHFTQRVSKTLNTIKYNPLIFRKSQILNNVYNGLIIKQVSVIYRVKDDSNLIELLAFIDNRQKPNKRLS